MSCRVSASLVMLLVAATLSAPAAATRFALSMGNNVGAADEPVLRWAESDAKRMANLLTELGGVTGDRMILSLSTSASDVAKAIAKLQGQVSEAHHRGERTEVVVYYSGHGDLETLHLGTHRYNLEDFQRDIKTIGADTVITILDACRSSPLRSGTVKGAKRAEAFDVDLRREQSPTGTVLIASASSFEVAQESDDWQSAFFSHHLFAALRGAGDANSDGVVTLGEAYAYAYRETLQESFSTQAAVQHPELKVALEGEGSLVLSALARAEAQISIPMYMPGAYLVTDGRTGRVIMELQHAGQRRLSLAVPSGQLLVRRRTQNQNYVQQVSMSDGERVVLDAEQFREVDRVASVVRGASDLTPWTVHAEGVLASHPFTKLTPFGGLAVGIERRMFSSPVSMFGRVRAIAGATRSPRWQFWDGTVRGTIGGTGDVTWRRFRLWAGGGAGVTFSRQWRRRFDQDRLQELGIASNEEWGWGVGPTITGRGGIVYLLGDDIQLRLGVETSASAFRTAGAVNAHFDGALNAGVGYEF